jgi:iron complex outermembrane receptor protein
MLGSAPPPAGAEPDLDRGVAAMSIEELANVEVTLVSRKPESRLRAAAAVYVLTREEIRRSGATSLPEALRLVPGVEVAKVNAHNWAISIRGFNGTTANKLLVLIDGRSVYSPLYSGVFWGVQHVLLEDIERIEVVAGPGGALWGANAVHGVINISTRQASDSQGGYAAARYGDEERGFAARYGWRVGEDTFARAYAQHIDRGSNELLGGGQGYDDWRLTQGGFRVDRASAAGDWTVQGDVYSGEEGGLINDSDPVSVTPGLERKVESRLRGIDLLGTWRRTLAADAGLQLQAYYDRTERRAGDVYDAVHSIYDVDAQINLRPAQGHDVVVGAEYRRVDDVIESSSILAFFPERRTDEVFSVFIQDQIALWQERLVLTLGSKFEHNDFTGFEYQPSVRLAFSPNERQTWWSAVSRAVRTPSRLESDVLVQAVLEVPTLPLPVLVTLRGDPNFDSEKLLAYEAGYRLQTSGAFWLDLVAFYHSYRDLRSTEAEPLAVVLDPPPHFLLPNRLANGLEGSSQGATLSARWQPTTAWQLRFGYSFIDIDLATRAGSNGGAGVETIEGSSPRHQLRLHSSFDLPRDIELDAGWRWVDRLEAGVGSYLQLDLRLGWRPRSGLELAVVGQNLLKDEYREFPEEDILLQRSVHGEVVWRF